MDGNTVLVFAIEPADEEEATAQGCWPFRIVEKINNPRNANEAWKAFQGAEEPAGK